MYILDIANNLNISELDNLENYLDLLSEEIMPQLQGKITNEEASAVVSIYWGSMERKNACDCNIKDIFESINEIERQNMEH